MTLKSIPEKIQPYIREGVKIILWFFMIAAVVIFILHSALAIAYPYSLDYGEAPLIDQARRLTAGENIYPADLSSPPYDITNYPPVYMLTLIPFLEWFDSPFHMGRVISVVAAVVTAILIGLTIHTFSKDRLASLVGASFFLAIPYVAGWSGLARIDSLALAFAAGALFVLARWPESKKAWLGGGLLLVAAIYTRQSYALAAPLAAFVWLWSQDKRRAVALALGVGGLSLALFFLLNWLTAGGFYFHVVTANVNEFGMERLRYNLERLWEDASIILLMGTLFLLIGWRTQKSWLMLAPFLVGAFLSSLTIGKIGSNINYFLELAAALALIAGMMVVWLRQYPWRNVLVIVLLIVQFGLLLQSSLRHNVDWILTPRYQELNYVQLLEQEVKNAQGLILADEHMGLLTMNDRPLYLQPFTMTQLARDGKWDQQPLLEEIASQAFDLILIHHFDAYAVHKERWTAEMLEAIDTYYRPLKTLSGTVVYIPQEAAGITPVLSPQATSGEITQLVEGAGPSPVGEASFVGEPTLALDPTDPNHVVALATRVSKQECNLPNCKVELVLFTSADGGNTWQERTTLGRVQRVLYNGLAAFDPTGAVYVLGILNDEIVMQHTTLADGDLPTYAGFESVTRAQMNARPWLRTNPETGTLYLTLDAQEENALFVTPSLLRSEDGLRWSIIARADQHISTTDINAGRANSLADIQVLFGAGNQVSLVWVWDSEPGSWPRTVWMANSDDGGVNFGVPVPILETWGSINTASANGSYAIVYRVGDETRQQLAVATTSDQGQSWHSVLASGEVPLFFDPDKGPGIGITADGTIDLVFYAHAPASTDCLLNVESWRWAQYSPHIDSCEYNVYYTYSPDGGISFSEPLQLNQQPIRGVDFVRYQGSSQVGSHLAVVSADAYALSLWIGTPAPGSTQVYSLRIER